MSVGENDLQKKEPSIRQRMLMAVLIGMLGMLGYFAYMSAATNTSAQR